ncbi:MAG: hypothetical protein U1E35_00965 [Rhodospirillales bacterium]
MTEPPAQAVPGVRFRRVLLALGTASGDPAAVERAAALAARLRGELLALLVRGHRRRPAGRSWLG